MSEAQRLIEWLSTEGHENSPKDCPHFDPPIDAEQCARCTGSTLAADDLAPPNVHDGRHGRSCGRCVGRHRRDIEATRLRL